MIYMSSHKNIRNYIYVTLYTQYSTCEQPTDPVQHMWAANWPSTAHASSQLTQYNTCEQPTMYSQVATTALGIWTNVIMLLSEHTQRLSHLAGCSMLFLLFTFIKHQVVKRNYFSCLWLPEEYSTYFIFLI